MDRPLILICFAVPLDLSVSLDGLVVRPARVFLGGDMLPYFFGPAGSR